MAEPLRVKLYHTEGFHGEMVSPSCSTDARAPSQLFRKSGHPDAVIFNFISSQRGIRSPAGYVLLRLD